MILIVDTDETFRYCKNAKLLCFTDLINNTKSYFAFLELIYILTYAERRMTTIIISLLKLISLQLDNDFVSSKLQLLLI